MHHWIFYHWLSVIMAVIIVIMKGHQNTMRYFTWFVKMYSWALAWIVKKSAWAINYFIMPSELSLGFSKGLHRVIK